VREYKDSVRRAETFFALRDERVALTCVKFERRSRAKNSTDASRFFGELSHLNSRGVTAERKRNF
jgi:hypothetical protein